MEALTRTPCPIALQQRGEEWTQRWVATRRSNPSARFQWPHYETQKLNHVLLDPLTRMSRGHCTYCDGYPIGAQSPPTIDHFRPKSTPEYAHLAFDWGNLFLACGRCQSAKLERFDDRLLKPDEPDYRFERYFFIDIKGDLVPLPTASLADKERARVTIELLDLNHAPLPMLRVRYIRAILAGDTLTEDPHAAPYRFLFRASAP